MKLYHGTSSANVDSIKTQGFQGPVYLTSDMEDAQYYAATGGEDDLQRREEMYAKTHGIKARKHFYPDMWDMYKALYPKEAYPVVLVINLPQDMMKHAKKDAGGVGGLCFKQGLPAMFITEVIQVSWTDELGMSYGP